MSSMRNALTRHFQPIELFKQAWNKPALQYRANNVMAMIERSNRISFWVASIILFQNNPEDRAQMILKFINIGEVRS